MFQTPILFLIFNRPDVTHKVFSRIREIRPRELFVAADGPRRGRPGEAELCAETRKIVSAIDWPCELKTRFHDENLGCRQAVSSAISWFFGQVEAGIILEDDCLPDASFFPFCSDLLARYADDQRIMHISGDNFQRGRRRGHADYYFSIYNHVWGWATWKRAWATYDVDMKSFAPAATRQMLEAINGSKSFCEYWAAIFEKTHKGEIDTWDYQWTYAIWRHSGLSILPQLNMVSNIGFGEAATHTQISSWQANLTAYSLHIQKHPTTIDANLEADRFTATVAYGIPDGWLSQAVHKLRAKLRLRTRLRRFWQ